jgi:hypothetical protein
MRGIQDAVSFRWRRWEAIRQNVENIIESSKRKVSSGGTLSMSYDVIDDKMLADKSTHAEIANAVRIYLSFRFQDIYKYMGDVLLHIDTNKSIVHIVSKEDYRYVELSKCAANISFITTDFKDVHKKLPQTFKNYDLGVDVLIGIYKDKVITMYTEEKDTVYLGFAKEMKGEGFQSFMRNIINTFKKNKGTFQEIDFYMYDEFAFKDSK